jgi:hypothetical protein
MASASPFSPASQWEYQEEMKTVAVTIKGVTPLLQHRFNEQAESNEATRKALVVRGTPREEAEAVCYRDKQGKFYFPGTWITSCLAEAGANHKLKGTRRSARFTVPAAVGIIEDAVGLTNGDGKTPIADFEVDSRPVTIPSTKGRIMRHRPRFDCWSASFHLRVNETLLPVNFIHKLLEEALDQGGLGDFRPQKRGPFGRAVVMEWKE